MTIYATSAVAAFLDAILQKVWLGSSCRSFLLNGAENPADNGVYRRGKDGRWYRPERRGLALVPIAERRIISRMGGETAQAMGKAHRWTPEQARAAGRISGRKAASVPGRMAALGRKGGFQVSADREHMRRIGKLGGLAVSRNRKHMAELGRRGGKAKGRKAHADT